MEQKEWVWIAPSEIIESVRVNCLAWMISHSIVTLTLPQDTPRYLLKTYSQPLGIWLYIFPKPRVFERHLTIPGAFSCMLLERWHFLCPWSWALGKILLPWSQVFMYEILFWLEGMVKMRRRKMRNVDGRQMVRLILFHAGIFGDIPSSQPGWTTRRSKFKLEFPFHNRVSGRKANLI